MPIAGALAATTIPFAVLRRTLKLRRRALSLLETPGISHLSSNVSSYKQQRTSSLHTNGPASASSSLKLNMSLKHIPASKLHLSTPTWWLESRFHFSFADYSNPANLEFGVLRVLNDDLVKPHAGFGTHGHRDMEIFTYVVDGKLTHKDSMGTAESLGRGSAQYMSAGTGVTHSEMNEGDDLLRFLQIWIKPDRRGHTPNYGSRIFTKADRHNKIQHILTGFGQYEAEKDSGSGVIPIHQDANIYVSETDPGFKQQFHLKAGRQAYLVCIEGSVNVNDVALSQRDALEARAVNGGLSLNLDASSSNGAHFMIIEMKGST